MRKRPTFLPPFVRNFLIFLGALLLTSALLYAVVPHERPVLEKTLERKDTCQVLIAGPSYVEMGILPSAFDAESRRIGLNLESCIYARGGLGGYELKHGLDLLLSERWPKLEHVIIDITLGDRIAFEEGNWFKPRLVDWHVWGSLPWLLDYYDRQRGSLLPHLPMLNRHVQHLLMNYLGIGRALPLLEAISHSREPRKRLPNGSPVTDPAEPVNVLEVDDYPELLSRLTREKAANRQAGETAQDGWPRELRALVRSHLRRDPIFLIAPVLSSKLPPRGAVRGKRRLHVLDFQDPARYPELYTPDVRGRTSHLRGKGPELYSQLLVQALHELRTAR
jgi:hypothetical protein